MTVHEELSWSHDFVNDKTSAYKCGACRELPVDVGHDLRSGTFFTKGFHELAQSPRYCDSGSGTKPDELIGALFFVKPSHFPAFCKSRNGNKCFFVPETKAISGTGAPHKMMAFKELSCG